MSVPASRILFTPLRWLRGSLFLATYRRSDAAFWRQHGSDGHWRPLGPQLSYRSGLIGMPRGSAGVLLFTLRGASGVTLKVARLELALKQAGRIHRQLLVVRDLDDGATTIELKDVAFDSETLEQLDGCLIGQLLIKLLELKDGEGNDVLGRKKVTILRPRLTLYRGQEFKRLRKRYWNVEKIRAEKQRLRNSLYQRLVRPAGQLWRPLTVRRLLYRCLTNDLMLSVVYWTRLLGTRESPLSETDAAAR